MICCVISAELVEDARGKKHRQMSVSMYWTEIYEGMQPLLDPPASADHPLPCYTLFLRVARERLNIKLLNPFQQPKCSVCQQLRSLVRTSPQYKQLLDQHRAAIARERSIRDSIKAFAESHPSEVLYWATDHRSDYNLPHFVPEVRGLLLSSAICSQLSDSSSCCRRAKISSGRRCTSWEL